MQPKQHLKGAPRCSIIKSLRCRLDSLHSTHQYFLSSPCPLTQTPTLTIRSQHLHIKCSMTQSISCLVTHLQCFAWTWFLQQPLELGRQCQLLMTYKGTRSSRFRQWWLKPRGSRSLCLSPGPILPLWLFRLCDAEQPQRATGKQRQVLQLWVWAAGSPIHAEKTFVSWEETLLANLDCYR